MAKSRRASELPYREGDWLWIPLGRSGLHGLARIARIGPKGKIITIYGFAPPRQAAPSPEELSNLKAESAVLVTTCGDLGILEGAWQVIPDKGRFVRTEWPMPSFGQWEEGASFGMRLDYVADAPNTTPLASRIPIEAARRLPRDVVAGYKALEIDFCRALGLPIEKAPAGERKPMTADHYTYFRSERIARSAADQMLRAVIGARAEIQQSDDKWRVVLSHRLNQSTLGFDEIVDRLKRIAVQRNGEYDGWERDV
jgi:hypothetical protein